MGDTQRQMVTALVRKGVKCFWEVNQVEDDQAHPLVTHYGRQQGQKQKQGIYPHSLPYNRTERRQNWRLYIGQGHHRFGSRVSTQVIIQSAQVANNGGKGSKGADAGHPSFCLAATADAYFSTSRSLPWLSADSSHLNSLTPSTCCQRASTSWCGSLSPVEGTQLLIQNVT